MTKLEIIDETVEYYQNNDRSISYLSKDEPPQCLYSGPNGSKCAFGRVLIKAAFDLISKTCNGASVGTMMDKDGRLFFNIALPGYTTLDEIVQPQYRGHGMHFWSRIQALHDDPTYWNGRILTDAGEYRVKELKAQFANNNEPSTT